MEKVANRLDHQLGDYDHQLEVDVSRIIVIDSPRSAQAFAEKYGIKDDRTGRARINWRRVAEEAAGIEIRMTPRWLYAQGLDGFDIPSACVWDKSAISSTALLSAGDLDLRMEEDRCAARALTVTSDRDARETSPRTPGSKITGAAMTRALHGAKALLKAFGGGKSPFANTGKDFDSKSRG